METQLLEVITEEEQFIRDIEGKTADLRLIPPDSPVLRMKIPDMRLEKLSDDELKTMEKMFIDITRKFGAVGIAPNQLGLPIRMFIVLLEGLEQAFFNPKIISISKETAVLQESCLSFPGLVVNIKRPKKVTLEYVNSSRETIVQEYDNWQSRVIFHEIGHVNGEIFLDLVSPLKLKMARKKQKKYLEAAIEKLKEQNEQQ